jgi:hypothetical protein
LALWGSRLAARPVLCAAIVYAVLSLVMVGQGLLPGRTLSSSDGLWSVTPWTASKPAGVRPLGSNFELADAVAVFQPFFQFTRSVLPDVPLWNPHLMAGRPYLADGQSAVFSPFSFPAYVLPFWKSLAAIAALKLFVGALGMFLFARALGLRFGGALLAGVVFAFGTFYVVWLPWPLTNIFPLIPWILLLTELVVRRPGPLPVAGLAALIGLQFLGGHPETSFHVMVVTVIWFLARALPAWSAAGRSRAALARPSIAFASAIVLGGALAALTLLPLAEFFLHSGDWSRRLHQPPSFAPREYLGAFFLFDYWGRPTQTPLAAFVSNRGYYAGGLTLMLAAVALALRPTRGRLALALFGVICMNVVLGLGPIADLVVKLPGFRTAHNGRLVIFVLMTLALLAAWGLDDLSGRELPSRRRRQVALAVAAAIVVFPVVWMLVAGTLHPGFWKQSLKVAWGFQDPPPTATGDAVAGDPAAPVIRLAALFEWLPLAGLGLVLIALRLDLLRRPSWRLPAAAFVALAVALLVVDLFRANMGFNPAIPVAHAQQPTTGAIRYLQTRVPNRFTGIGQLGPPNPLPADIAMRYGLYDARGYDYPVEKRYDNLWRGTAGPSSDLVPPTTVAQPTAESLRTLSLLGVTDVLQSPGDAVLRLPGLSVAYSGSDARVYRNRNALPRVFLVGGQQTVANGDAALAAVKGDALDPRRVAVTERPVAGLASGAGSTAAGTARLVSYGRERVVARATAPRTSLLVLTDVYYPGWKAFVDGRETPIERVDYLLRGVRVPAGSHDVEFRYEPSSWRFGWLISALALLTLVLLTAVGLRRRRAGG